MDSTGGVLLLNRNHISECRASKGSGGVMYLFDVSFESSYNFYVNNSAIDAAVIQALSKTNVSSDHDIYLQNTADIQAGVATISLTSGYHALFSYCKFQSNAAGVGSVLIIFTAEYVSVIDSQFSNNSGTISGAIVHTLSNLFIIRTKFYHNTVLLGSGAAILSQSSESSTTIEDVSIVLSKNFSLVVDACEFSHNQVFSTLGGGAVTLSNVDSVVLSNNVSQVDHLLRQNNQIYVLLIPVRRLGVL